MKKLFVFLLFAGFVLNGCTDNDDNTIVASADLEVQDFIWENLNFWYFWQGDVPDLADDRFATNSEYTAYLRDFSDPGDLFDQLLYVDDRFSYITDDYEALQDSQQGVFKTNGVEFGLIQFSESNDLFGYVRYILPDSDASVKGIDRGDLFTGVNGTQLTINNYIDLLFGDNDEYTLNMADIAGGVISANGIEVGLTKTEYTENPVFIARTIDVSGQNVGYLMYNGFTSTFEDELNNAFGQFDADGVTDLIIDLRYNPGGSIGTSVRLASMITGQFNGELFARERWNEKVQSLLSSQQLNNDFTAQLGDGTAINSLNLTTVYVLTTGSSASASELLINGLSPYINVIQIGTTTRGKNEGSITLLDYIDEEGNINPNHTWAIQPLVLRLENSAGFYDYTEGLVPNTELAEDLENLGVLGEVDEPLLAEAIAQISGGMSKSLAAKTIQMPVRDEVADSKRFTPTSDKMYKSDPVKIPFKNLIPDQ